MDTASYVGGRGARRRLFGQHARYIAPNTPLAFVSNKSRPQRLDFGMWIPAVDRRIHEPALHFGELEG